MPCDYIRVVNQPDSPPSQVGVRLTSPPPQKSKAFIATLSAENPSPLRRLTRPLFFFPSTILPGFYFQKCHIGCLRLSPPFLAFSVVADMPPLKAALCSVRSNISPSCFSIVHNAVLFSGGLLLSNPFPRRLVDAFSFPPPLIGTIP